MKTKKPEEIFNLIQELESTVADAIPKLLQKKIIVAFENRGWALYAMNTSDAVVLDEAELAEVKNLRIIVENGRAKEHLNVGKKYCLLPLHEMDSNWEIISLLLTEILAKSRGPYFIELKEASQSFQPIAVYFINYIVVTPPIVELIFNATMSWSPFPINSNIITVSIDHIDTILKTHLQLSIRTMK
ncbi:hypothetical protein ACFL08_04030 [Patescibacteria group bacterium]